MIKKKTGIKKNFRDKMMDVVLVIGLGIFALICIYPFYYVVINSISENAAVMKGEVWLVPVNPHLENYMQAFRLRGFARATLITLLRTVLGTLATLISCTILGYVFTKQEYWHRKFWYRFVVFTMYFSAGLIPGYMNIRRLGLLNNFWVYILPAFVAPYNLVLVKTYIESIPQSLEEAAFIDGAGYAQRFLRIVLPLSKPIIATIAIFAAVGQWNSYMDTILYMTGNDNRTLQSLLYEYLKQADKLAEMLRQSADPGGAQNLLKNAVSTTSIQYTITTITLLPILLVYPFFQRFFAKGIMIGAVKG